MQPNYIELGLIHSVHTSERKARRGCPRRWNWVYNEGYHPPTSHRNLEFGIAWHIAMETWYDPDAWHKDRDHQRQLAVSAMTDEIDKQLKMYMTHNDSIEDQVIQDYDERMQLGIQMMNYYAQKVSPTLDVGLTPLAVEIPFEVELGFNCKCKRCMKLWIESPFYIPDFGARAWSSVGEYFKAWPGLPVTFGGRIDAIFQDDEGRLLVFDWKSAQRLMDDIDEAAFLQLDDQVAGYPAALHKLGRPVDGFIYHEQRKAVPQVPAPLKRPYKGRLFSTDKNAPVEYTSFVETISKDDLNAYAAGLYDEYIQYLRSPMAPKFFQRHTIYKSPTQIENFWNDLVTEARDMINNPLDYPTPSRFSCNSCAFRVPCEGKNRGEDYRYTLDTMYLRG